MKKQEVKISNQEEFNKHLQRTSPITWIVLGLVIALLGGFFTWGYFYKVTAKVMGIANIVNGEATLQVKEADVKKLMVGQKVYIEELEGEIISFLDDQPVVSNFELADGEYTYKVIIGEKRPIDFLFGK